MSLSLQLMPNRRSRIAAAPDPQVLPRTPRLPTLACPRVRLRDLDEHDLDALYTVFSDPLTMRYWSRPPFAHREDAVIYLESIHRGFEDGSLFQWGVARNDDDHVIGTCTLAQIDHADSRAEVGFALCSTHWGQGFGREALAHTIDHAFGYLGLRRLEADVDPRNMQSLKALEKLGFKREGYLRQRWRVNGAWQDSIMLGLLSTDARPALPR
jgi:RimJ/RimL family protein N-acetyltransferase